MSISGKYMGGLVGAVFISGNYAWSAEETADALDGTTSEDGGYENEDDGVWGCAINLKGYMDVAEGQYTPVRRGTLVINLKLYRDVDDAVPAFVFPLAKVFQSTQGGEVKGKVEWTARLKSKGPYEYHDPA